MTLPDVTTPAAIAAARIEALEVQVAWWEEQGRQQANRIEQLEAALREIANGYVFPSDGQLGRLMHIARAALDKDNGK